MIIDLSRRIALITGSTAGIGLAIAKALHHAGADIIINGRTDKRVEAAVTLFSTQERVRGIAADVGTSAGCEKLFAKIPHVDILINNTGVFEPKPVFEISDAEWEKFFAINVMSGIRLSRHYIPNMIEQQWGRVVFISSESAIQIPPEMVHYGMTKTAQLAIARGFAETVAGNGVTVNSVLPGPTLSEGVEKFIREMVPDPALTLEEASREFIKQARSTSLLGRMTSAEEVANMVVYLCSYKASATTGAAVRVDGGVLRGLL
ncbi:SDR family NAD(P)-dependent oxidoreductase [Fastidiosibacter lacustris]|uniref:SDR family NAD(P)-dependent oxidoreductase n=1 Tax=Fastidiosibacter lacustris TaxID=2056695 RepID=UPI000E354E22|nr:SDR family oxidoreductase [Fastidiosibacter lacustris]